MAAPASVRVWFRLEGAASADFLDVSSNNNVAQLRKAIYAELKAKLEPRGVIASDLVLSTAGKTYDNEEATVPTVHQTKKDALIVTGTFVRAARSPFAAAAYGPRRSHPCSCLCALRAVLLVLVALRELIRTLSSVRPLSVLGSFLCSNRCCLWSSPCLLLLWVLRSCSRRGGLSRAYGSLRSCRRSHRAWRRSNEKAQAGTPRKKREGEVGGRYGRCWRG
jgi:hypothetical protein